MTELELPDMKIISWNLKYDNLNQKSDLQELLDEYNPDVLCLQEVSAETIRYLKSLQDRKIYFCLDLKTGNQLHREVFLAIVTSKDIEVKHHRKFPIHHLTRKSLFDRLRRLRESIEYHFVDINFGGLDYRVFNVHLEVGAGPKIRVEQFKEILRYFGGQKLNIVCGDFNIYARWYLNLFLGWAYGFRLQEYLVNERRTFEKIFSGEQLTNVFRNKVTYPAFRLQLDHILVPQNLKLKDQMVIRQKHGSDHYPLLVKF
ncbi:MAG: hypothetical protein OHK0017_13860 [Patescibacteria group bacterium]